MTQNATGQIIQRESQALVIEAGHAELHYWSDLWRYRELLFFLAWRDLSVRYKQTLLGVAWVVLRPLLTMTVFTVVFSKLAGLPSGHVPYPVMVFAALLPWQLFASAITDSGNSIVNNSGMISKVYFPRLIIPFSTIIVSLVDFLVSASLLLVLIICYGLTPTWRVLTLPLFIVLAVAISIGAGLWVATLNVRYRDFRFILSFAIQLGLYISPVGFSSAIVPDKWRLVYAFNPMVGVIDGFRWALLADDAVMYWPGLFLSVLMAVLLLISAIAHFRKSEKSFADDI